MDSALSKAHLSHIFDRNSYPQSDKLYDPLRQAIQTHQFRGQNRFTPDKIDSRVSTQFKDLSQNDAALIMQNTSIPIDKRLKPTDHLHRVEGKYMVAIDHKVNVGQPISEEELRQRLQRGGGRTEKIVYELQDYQSVRKRKQGGINWISMEKYERQRTNVYPTFDNKVQSRLYVVRKDGSSEGLTQTIPIGQLKKSQKKQTEKKDYSQPKPTLSRFAQPKRNRSTEKQSNQNIEYRSLKSRAMVKSAQNQLVKRYRPPPLTDQQYTQEQIPYNCYSAIDEPLNRMKQAGCKSVRCPGNECIASRVKSRAMAWIK